MTATINAPTAPHMLTTEQAAEVLGMSPATLNTWRCTRKHMLPYVKVGQRCVRYRMTDLLAYLDCNSCDG